MATPASPLVNAADLGLSSLNSQDAPFIGDLRRGGQLGVGINAQYIDNSTPLALTPAVIVVLKTPKMYDKRPAIAKMIKNVMETCPKSVTGIDVELTLATGESPAGHDGQQIRVPTQTTRSAVDPSFVFNEVPGNLIWRLFTGWIQDIQDPDTNASMQGISRVEGVTPPPYLLSSISSTIMVIQFDQTMIPDRIIEASMITNMYPTTAGPLGLQRVIGETQVIERSVQFVGNIFHNDHIRKKAVALATTLQLANARYAADTAESRTVERDDVDELLTESGLAAEAAEAAAASNN